MKDCIEVDFEEIVEILLYLGARRIAGEILAGEGVHIGVEAAARHGEEGVFNREFLRAAKNSVLEDVGNAIGLGGERLEGEAKEVFGIVIGDVEDAGPCGGVNCFNESGLQFFERKVFCEEKRFVLGSYG